jgi:hypothetical protein
LVWGIAPSIAETFFVAMFHRNACQTGLSASTDLTTLGGCDQISLRIAAVPHSPRSNPCGSFHVQAEEQTCGRLPAHEFVEPRGNLSRGVLRGIAGSPGASPVSNAHAALASAEPTHGHRTIFDTICKGGHNRYEVASAASA